MRRIALATGQSTAAVLAAAAASWRERLGWQEVANKLEAYGLFRNAAGVLGLRGRGLPLAAQVARAQALGPYRALWVIEGLGFRHAERGWRRGAEPGELLGGEEAADLPAGSLVALHCGMALSLAGRLLAGVHASVPSGELRRTLGRFIGAGRECSRPGYAGAVLEGLGFSVRLLRPRWVPAIARELPGLEAEVDAYFWHGVGRALYFLPANLSPRRNAPWRAVAMALAEPSQGAGPGRSAEQEGGERGAAEPPAGRARNNALAGLAWAVVLINLRHPPLLAAFLRQHAALAEDAAFVNGVGSALRVWRDCMPDDPYVAALHGFRPAPGLAPGRDPARSDEIPARSDGFPALPIKSVGDEDAGFARLWQRSIVAACAAALAEDYPGLRERGGLGELFRFAPAAAVAEGGSAGAPEMPGARRDRC